MGPYEIDAAGTVPAAMKEFGDYRPNKKDTIRVFGSYLEDTALTVRLASKARIWPSVMLKPTQFRAPARLKSPLITLKTSISIATVMTKTIWSLTAPKTDLL